ncbi:hypothetical protein BDV59DRAFT_166555 [Aspergillus ambiguus]|uniref:uncharacterized protein n=1 Tax=Aspergillus ambiguus TaxID=176160 RepID=UPI003CCD016B
MNRCRVQVTLRLIRRSLVAMAFVKLWVFSREWRATGTSPDGSKTIMKRTSCMHISLARFWTHMWQNYIQLAMCFQSQTLSHRVDT